MALWYVFLKLPEAVWSSLALCSLTPVVIGMIFGLQFYLSFCLSTFSRYRL